MQTALHIMALAAELKQQTVGGVITAVEYYRKERTIFIIISKDRTRSAFCFSYHPMSFGCYVVPASKVSIDTRERPRSVLGIEGAVVQAMEQVDFDRILQFSIKGKEETRILVIEALGPNGNLWLLDEAGVVLGSLRGRASAGRQRYTSPPPPQKLSPLQLSEYSLGDILNAAGRELPSVAAIIEKRLLGFDRLLAREVEVRSGLTSVDPAAVTAEQLPGLSHTISAIVERFRKPEVGYLYRMSDAVGAYPLKLSSVDRQPEKFKTLSLAVQAASLIRRMQVETVSEEKTVKDAVIREIKRLKRRLGKIERDIATAADYDRYRRLGELLQIHFDTINKGMDQTTVEDVYSDSTQSVTITLDPALTPAENIKAYFKKYRKGRDGLELLQRRLEVTKQELAHLDSIHSGLERDFDSARERYRQEITPLLPSEARRREEPARLPYREYTLSTGVRIYVGRGGGDNDRTTFEYAKPYELWFHTQQCPGSHVVMKFPNKSFEPSRLEIEEAAAVAAYHSKARNDRLVPVIYTQRKYVRKPRKAAPGLVTVEREKSVMVEPRKPGAPPLAAG
ncbi:MAG: NFACT family protein [Candidatus Zixiibacteriota bacterium]